MHRGLLAGLNIDLYPRLHFGAGDVVLGDGAGTDRLLVVIDGRIGAGVGHKTLGPGDLIKPVEFFGAPNYFGDLRARSAAKIAIVPRAAVRACLEAQGAMTWSIACAIAIEAIAAVGEMS
jgi:CRP-like cAMP-binding protein